MTNHRSAGTAGMSEYERRRWSELEKHWARAERRPILPEGVRRSATRAGERIVDVGGRAAHRVADAAPRSVKDVAGTALDATLAPTVKAVVHLLELVTDWSVELADPERVFEHHRKRGREVTSLEDLPVLDLELLDELTKGLKLRWRSLGAAEGAAVGALAFVPVAGGLAAITVDVLAMHVLSTSIATRAAHAYGFDPSAPATEKMIDRMVRRVYREQAPKVTAQRQTHTAFAAAAGRQRWSDKLRTDHRILAAVEKLMKQAGGGAKVSVGKAAKALPAIAVVTGAGINSYVLGDVADKSVLYAQTVLLSQKYGMPLPPKLRDEVDEVDDVEAG